MLLVFLLNVFVLYYGFFFWTRTFFYANYQVDDLKIYAKTHVSMHELTGTDESVNILMMSNESKFQGKMFIITVNFCFGFLDNLFLFQIDSLDKKKANFFFQNQNQLRKVLI